MSPILRATLAVAGLSAFASAARAVPFDPADVPADSQYVLHVDMDALRPTRLWHAINDRLVGNEAFGAKMGLFEQGTGMHFPRDLHGVTVFGKSPGDQAAVVVIRAKMNRPQFMAALQFADNYAAETFGKYDVASWDDDQRKMYGAFHDDNTLLFARSVDNLKAALDVLDAKSPRVAATEPLAAGAKQPALAYVAATGLSTVAGPGGGATLPAMRQLDHGWLTVTERARPATQPAPTGDAADKVADADKTADAVLHVSIDAKNPDAAKQLMASATGLRAMVGLAAMSDTADPNVKLLAGLLRTLNVAQSGNTLTGDLSAGVDQLEQLADHAGHHDQP